MRSYPRPAATEDFGPPVIFQELRTHGRLRVTPAPIELAGALDERCHQGRLMQACLFGESAQPTQHGQARRRDPASFRHGRPIGQEGGERRRAQRAEGPVGEVCQIGMSGLLHRVGTAVIILR